MTARRRVLGSADSSKCLCVSNLVNSALLYKLLVAVACFWFASLMLFTVYESERHSDGPALIHEQVHQQLPETDDETGLLDRFFEAHPQRGAPPRKFFWQPPQLHEAPVAFTAQPQLAASEAQRIIVDHMATNESERRVSNSPVPQFESTSPSDAPGEMGKAVTVQLAQLTATERQKYDTGLQQNAFNQYVSDMISVRRRLPDVRDAECKSDKFESPLPDVSVVVCFHNEAWSVLRRTLWSIIDRSQPSLLREVLLVDDASTATHLGPDLDQYVAQFSNGLVKVLRAKKREGLIRARLLGASAATGQVVVFLDSHIECTAGWLEPLLFPILRNWSTVTVPVIDVIDDNTFAFSYNNAHATQIGGFDWNLQYTWRPVPPDLRANRRSIDPLPTPTMAGGLFAISRAYFEHIGSYDPGMEIWGGENLELSFRIWMCGGSLLIIPCSHVGHVFRKRSPYSWAAGGPNPLRKNSVRLAEVWMDDYRKYYYERINHDLGNYGDVSARKALRDRLQCKSFDWFVKHIYPDLFIPGESLAKGEIRNSAFPKCVDSPSDHNSFSKRANLWPCHGQGGNQYWLLSKNNEIRRDDACVDYPGGNVIMYHCHGMKGNQHWLYLDTKQLRHVVSGKCLAVNSAGKELTMEPCNVGESRQIWSWQRMTPKS